MEKLAIFAVFLLIEAIPGVKLENLTQGESDVKIVGGQEIQLSAAPYQVSLQKEGYHECGGSIITTTHILTAAHCTYLIRPRQLSVRVGTARVNSGGEIFAVKAVFSHPGYNPTTYNNDFSIVQLNRKITLKAGVKATIALPPLNDPIANGELAFVSGWGDTLVSSESAMNLRGVTVPIVDQNVCKRVYSILTNNMVCAGDLKNGGIDSCQVRFMVLVSINIFSNRTGGQWGTT